MSAADWIEDRLERRRLAARRRIAERAFADRRQHRVWERDIARASLAASLLVLGILLVELGRRATHLIG